MEDKNHELVDYIKEGSKTPIEFAGHRKYASINVLIAPHDEGLEHTGYFYYTCFTTVLGVYISEWTLIAMTNGYRLTWSYQLDPKLYR